MLFRSVNKLLCQLLWEQVDDGLATLAQATTLLADSRGMLHAAEHVYLAGMIHALAASRPGAPRRHLREVAGADLRN